MGERKRAALLCLCLLLALVGSAVAEDSICTYVQPDGVAVCVLEDIVYYPAPEGLQPMYSLMGSNNPSAYVYLFIMPNGRALMTISSTVTGENGTAQGLMDAWDRIAAGLSSGVASAETDVSAASMGDVYGFDGLRVTTTLETLGDSPLRLKAEGAAFYRGSELLELWSLWPDAETDPQPEALAQDLKALAQLQASLCFTAESSASR